MNRAGHEGRGESVWLAFLLFDMLTQFAPLARSHQHPVFAEHCLDQAKPLEESIERHGWDGQWNRRAFKNQDKQKRGAHPSGRAPRDFPIN